MTIFSRRGGTGSDTLRVCMSGLNIGGAGATTSKMALPEGLSRDESEAEIDEVRKRYAAHERYSRSGLVQRAQDLQFDVQHGLESDPNEDPEGGCLR